MSDVAAPPQTNYEIYVQDGSGRWVLHARLGASERKRAMEEGRALEAQKGTKGVRVVKEVYYPSENHAEEVVIYRSRDKGDAARSGGQKPAKGRPATTKAAPSAKGPAPAPFSTEPPAPKRPAAKTKPAATPQARQHRAGGPKPGFGVIEVLVKLALIFLVSLGFAALGAMGASYGLEQLSRLGVTMSRTLHDQMVFLTFVASFLIGAVPMLMRLLRKIGKPRPMQGSQELLRAATRPAPRAPRRPAAAPAPPPAAPPAPESPVPEPTADASPTPDDAPGAEDLADSVAPADAPPPAAGPEMSSPAAEEPPIEPPPATVPDTPRFREARQSMMRFLGDSIDAVKTTRRQLDAYNKFGVNLFVAGACDACAAQSALDPHDREAIVKDCVSTLGSAPSMAEKFCANIDEYLLEPRYSRMYRAGHDSMGRYMAQNNSGPTGIDAALDAFNEKGGTRHASEVVAIMFTDIINSTKKTQELGDVGAQKMVHAHNTIVRTALTFHGGKEIKHLGDGIMASFGSPAEAVAAAIKIQTDITAFNAGAPDTPFEVRIGLNAGDPIREDNDLFGATVQLAARICAKAGADEIFVSTIMRQLINGRGFTTASKGAHTLKGFGEAHEIYEVVWR